MIRARLIQAGKVYGNGVKTRALAPTTLSLFGAEVTLLLGPSGSGKTTLLNLLGALDYPSEGRVEVEGHNLSKLGRRALTLFRRQYVGFVFQFFNLVPTLTARENVALASELVKGSRGEVDGWLDRVGIGSLGDRFPSELSGGQQQRVAIARALAKKPRLLLADEPTGALDQETGQQVLALLKDTATAADCTVVVVTHDEGMISLAHRIVRLRDGVVMSDSHSTADPKGA